MSFAWSLGLTLAPIMGGTLANAASRWPDTFGRIPYIRTHPYFLPCLVAGAYTFVTFVFDCFALKETLPSIVAKENAKHQNSASVDEETPLLINIQQDQSNYAASQSSSPPPATGLSSTMTSEPTNIPRNSQPHAVLTRPVLLTLANHVCLTFTDMCHYALLPLMYSTPIEYGGLGLDPYHIGIALGAFGLVNAIVQVKTLGPVVRRFGPRRAYRVAYSFLLGIFAMYPILHFLVQRAGRVDGFVIAGIFVQLSFQVMIYMAYGSLQMILVESVPEGGPLGTVNGVGQMLGSGMRCIAPTFATSLFSVSIQRNLAGGNMVYYILLALTVIAVHCSAFLPARPARTSDGRQS
ncbi:MFS general substrate transporter [Agrocybe pediades]|nr:MFS general substrate transporter [Agrocybe pediades]